MRNNVGLSQLKFKKLKELIKVTLCNGTNWFSFNKVGGIRYASNILSYIFTPKTIDFLEFCINDLPIVYKITIKSNYTIDQIIDIAYSNFILEEYNISDLGANFKFDTIRNVFKYHFKSKEYMINHYSHKLSLPIICFLKKEFMDKDILNIVSPIKVNLMTTIRNIENGIIDHVKREYALIRAGPYNTQSLSILVA